MKTLVMMPTYNELGTLENSIRELFLHNPQVELLIIDDNSPDGTGQLAEKFAAIDARIHVMHREKKEGLGFAYLAGYRWGLANAFELLVQMDADGSHRSEDLGKLLQLAAGNALVIGSRWIHGGAVSNWPLYRQAISKFGNWYAAKMLAIKLGDLTAGFRVYGADLLRILDLKSVSAHGYGFQVEMTKKVFETGAPIFEAPILFVERTNGKSKMTLAIVLEAFLLSTRWGIARCSKR